eukprot:6445275-Alexandrium_andersonii.AAC.1
MVECAVGLVGVGGVDRVGGLGSFLQRSRRLHACPRTPVAGARQAQPSPSAGAGRSAARGSPWPSSWPQSP